MLFCSTATPPLLVCTCRRLRFCPRLRSLVFELLRVKAAMLALSGTTPLSERHAPRFAVRRLFKSVRESTTRVIASLSDSKPQKRWTDEYVHALCVEGDSGTPSISWSTCMM